MGFKRSFVGICLVPVSYTHLDVYKRQNMEHSFPLRLPPNGKGYSKVSIDYCLRRLRARPHERKLIPSRKGAAPAESFWP